MAGGDKGEKAREAAAACIRCGACMSVCPVYRAGRREPLVARGKLALIAGSEEGGIARDRKLAEGLGRCLLCGRCTENCPNMVEAAEGIRSGREAVASEVGAPFLKKLLLEKMLPSPGRMGAAARAARLGKSALDAVPADSGLWLRLPSLERGSRLPAPAGRPFLSDAPVVTPGPAGAPRAALFVGCVGNYLRPGLIEKAVRLLSGKYTVVAPRGQVCCGLPAVAAGLGKAAADMARRNLEAILAADVEKVVTTCGSCLHAMAHEWPRLLQSAQAEELAGRVVEISQVLCGETGLRKDPNAPRGPVAVHDPCHMSVGLKVTEEPRRMLENAGWRIAGMEGQDQCCGGGGLFAVNEPELSRAIFEPRSRALRQSGAKVLATSCSGCFLQWRSNLPRDIEVVHPLELVDG